MYNGFLQNDLANRSLNNNIFNSYFGNVNSAFNPLSQGINMGMAPFMNVYDQTMGYLTGTQNLFNPYMGMYQLPSGPKVGGN
jgi:hypothetical protein